MKRIFFSILTIITIIIHLISCAKHRGDIEEHIPSATLTFSSPAFNSIYHNGDSVPIQAMAISSEVVHGYDVSIHKKSDTAVLFFKHIHDHNDTLFISQKWASEVPGPTDLEAKVLLYLDHDGHTCTKNIEFKVQ